LAGKIEQRADVEKATFRPLAARRDGIASGHNKLYREDYP
jgi:hypothetical protein